MCRPTLRSKFPATHRAQIHSQLASRPYLDMTKKKCPIGIDQRCGLQSSRSVWACTRAHLLCCHVSNHILQTPADRHCIKNHCQTFFALCNCPLESLSKMEGNLREDGREFETIHDIINFRGSLCAQGNTRRVETHICNNLRLHATEHKLAECTHVCANVVTHRH